MDDPKLIAGYSTIALDSVEITFSQAIKTAT